MFRLDFSWVPCVRSCDGSGGGDGGGGGGDGGGGRRRGWQSHRNRARRRDVPLQTIPATPLRSTVTAGSSQTPAKATGSTIDSATDYRNNAIENPVCERGNGPSGAPGTFAVWAPCAGDGGGADIRQTVNSEVMTLKGVERFGNPLYRVAFSGNLRLYCDSGKPLP